MRKFFHLGTCSTCQRIIKELELSGVELQDIKKTAITVEQVEEMGQLAGGFEKLFSRKAMKYRSLGLQEMVLHEADYKKYILLEYTFLSRPVLVFDDQIFVGNSKKNVMDMKVFLSKR